MKLSEMKTQDAFEAMVKMLPHVTAILEDSDIVAEKEKIKNKTASGGQSFGAILPLVLGRHADDIFCIVAAASGMAEKDIREMPLAEMKVLFDEVWKDILDFFPLCLRLVMSA